MKQSRTHISIAILSVFLFIFQTGCMSTQGQLSRSQIDTDADSREVDRIELRRQEAQVRKQEVMKQIHSMVVNDSAIIQERSLVYDPKIGTARLENATNLSAFDLPLTMQDERELDKEADRDAEMYFENGSIHLQMDNYERAAVGFLMAYKTAVNKELKAKSLYWLGEVHFRDQNWKNAIECCDRFVQEFPNHSYLADVLLKQGLAYQRSDEWQQARESYLRLVRRFPNSSEAREAERKLQAMIQ